MQKKLEEDLSKIISNINGAGKTNILITIDREIESVYQTDIDTNNKSDGENSQYSNKSSTVVIRGRTAPKNRLRLQRLCQRLKVFLWFVRERILLL